MNTNNQNNQKPSAAQPAAGGLGGGYFQSFQREEHYSSRRRDLNDGAAAANTENNNNYDIVTESTSLRTDSQWDGTHEPKHHHDYHHVKKHNNEVVEEEDSHGDQPLPQQLADRRGQGEGQQGRLENRRRDEDFAQQQQGQRAIGERRHAGGGRDFDGDMAEDAQQHDHGRHQQRRGSERQQDKPGQQRKI